MRRHTRTGWISRVSYIAGTLLLAGMSIALARGFAEQAKPGSFPAVLAAAADHLSKLRGFEEALVPFGPSDAAEDRALLVLVQGWFDRNDGENTAELDQFIRSHPRNAWTPSLALNLGLIHYRQGRFTQALEQWQLAWDQGRNADGVAQQRTVQRAYTEMLRMYSRVGRKVEVARLLEQGKNLRFSGPASGLLTQAHEALWLMENEPGRSFMCGPFALRTLLSRTSPQAPGLRVLNQVESPRGGFDMASLVKLSEKIGMPMKAVRRSPGTPIPVPSVLHWKLSHYAAVVEQRDGRYHLIDPTFGNEFWVSQAALDEESSGYMLVPRDLNPAQNLQLLAQVDASRIFGMGQTGNQDDNRDGNDDCKSGGGSRGTSVGMARCAAHTMMVSLTVDDTPLSYLNALGERIEYKLTYNQRDIRLPANANFSNFGLKWGHNLLSWIQDDGTSEAASVTRVLAGGGAVAHGGYNTNTREFARDQNGDLLVKTSTSPIRYELRHSDGSFEVYKDDDGGVGSRRVFLSQKVDHRGRTESLSYDQQMRLIEQSDATGLVTRLSYEAADSYQITRITDPHGRHADFTYNAQGNLESITDAEGLVSSFGYDAASPDRMISMTNPYGTTQFLSGESTENGPRRWLEITDPDGRTERIEALHSAPGINFADELVPATPGLPFRSTYMNMRNTFYWDAETYQNAHNSFYPKSSMNYMDYTKAQRTHFLHTPNNQTSGVVESTLKPLENRFWYQYPGQTDSIWLNNVTLEKPSLKARVLDNGNTWFETYEYNGAGQRTVVKDSNGRETRYLYDEDTGDLLNETRVLEGALVPWMSYTYNSQHLPLTVTDRFGRTIRYRYNSEGQITTITGPFGDETNYTYVDGRLAEISRNNEIALGLFEYDDANRIRAMTDANGLRRTYTYDKLDRLLTTTYPDGTSESVSYDRQEIGTKTDRDGRSVTFIHDGRGHTLQTLRSDGRTSSSAWYGNDQMKSSTDPLGRVTTWEFDKAGRVTSIGLPDGNKIDQSYDSMGRLLSVTDPKNNVTRYRYDGQNNRTRNESPDSGVSTATYDTYGNVLSSTDAKGQSTVYNYDKLSRPILITYADGQQTELIWDKAANGLGQVSRLVHTYPASLFPLGSPFAGKLTYNYSYDVRGLRTGETRTLPNGQVSTTSYSYDPIGRLTQIIYPSGRSAMRAYDAEGRLISNTFAMAQGAGMNALTYSPGGKLLEATWALWNSFPAFPSALSQAIKNTFDEAGRLDSYTLGDRQVSLEYDPGSRLNWNTDPANKPLLYGYDDFDRLITQADATTTLNWKYDKNGNRILRQQGEVESTYDVLSSSNRLKAVDKQIVQTDLNGAVFDDGRQISYDARGFVIKVQNGKLSGSYLVDPYGRRVAKVNSDGLTSFDYGSENELLSEKRPDGTRLEHLWHQGRPIVATTGTQTAYVYADQLGTPRLLRSASNGSVLWQWSNAEAFGASSVMGTWAYNLRFPGQYYDKESGLHYNWNRYYDPTRGRYTQSDPIGLEAGINTYSYVGGNPLSYTDPDGLQQRSTGIPIVRGVSSPIRPAIAGPAVMAENSDWRSLMNTVADIPGQTLLPGEYVGINYPWTMPKLIKVCDGLYPQDDPNAGGMCKPPSPNSQGPFVSAPGQAPSRSCSSWHYVYAPG